MSGVLVAGLAAAQVLFTVHDARVDEASGIARGLRSPGVYYVHNDSGDSARVFALDRATGRTAATITVPGATNVDWEDLAVARDAAGRPSVWIADIGDNDAVRSQVQLYRLTEPAIAATDRGRRVTASRPDVWHLRYPDGAHNAEALAVRTGGTAYVITKDLTGVSGVYRVPAHPSSAVQTMRRIGTIHLPTTGRSIPGAGPFASVLATGASLSADGTRLVVRTYTEAYVWTVRAGDVGAALRTRPVHVVLPDQKQGEGVTIDGTRLVVNSEGTAQPVYAVVLPAAAPTAIPSASATSTVPPTPTQSTRLRPGRAGGNGAHRLAIPAVTTGGILALAAVVAFRRRRRKTAG